MTQEQFEKAKFYTEVISRCKCVEDCKSSLITDESGLYIKNYVCQDGMLFYLPHELMEKIVDLIIEYKENAEREFDKL